MSSITPVELRVVETVLGMGGGYVLDFTNDSFERFLRASGIEIYQDRFGTYGGSKAKRFRRLVELAPDDLMGRVLDQLWEYRQAASDVGVLRDQDATSYAGIVDRLLGRAQTARRAHVARSEATESDLLKLVFKQEVFSALPVENAIGQLLIDRMEEARHCIDAGAYLSAVIMCGSVLEGMCLGYGSRFPERVNRGYASRYGKDAKRLTDWRLAEWIEVLGHIGVLSQNVLKFGSALREFRNYVHPAEQLGSRFNPDLHTARIGFQVVVAAADDVVRSGGKG